jgi:hypothetical protein
MPFVRELMPYIEETQTRTGQVTLCSLIGHPAQHFPTFACRVVQVQNHVSKRINVELVVLLWKLDAPAAHCPLEFERQVAFVTEVKLEQPCIVLRA